MKDLVPDFVRRFEEDCRIRGMTPETTRRYGSSIRIYSQFLASRQIDLLSVDKNVLRSFLEYLRHERGCEPEDN